MSNIRYERLKSYCQGFNQRSKYHDLDLLEHIEKAVKYAEDKGFNNLIIEALKWHDFGKINCITFKDGACTYPGHAKEGAKLYKSISEDYNEYVKELIYYHNTPITKKLINKMGLTFCKDLFLMQEADHYAHSEYAKTHKNNILRIKRERDLLDSYSSEEKIQNRLREDYNLARDNGYEVVGVFLQGSQNYGIEDNDIYTIVVVMPKLEQLILGEHAADTLYVFSDKNVRITSIRALFNVMKGFNINYLELLFTKYKLLNSKYSEAFAPLFIHREELCFCDLKHLYGYIIGDIYASKIRLNYSEKEDYDVMDYYTAVRAGEFLKHINSGMSFKDSLTSYCKEELRLLKQGNFSLEEMQDATKIIADWAKGINQSMKFPDANLEVQKLYDNVLVNLVRIQMKEELK